MDLESAKSLAQSLIEENNKQFNVKQVALEMADDVISRRLAEKDAQLDMLLNRLSRLESLARVCTKRGLFSCPYSLILSNLAWVLNRGLIL